MTWLRLQSLRTRLFCLVLLTLVPAIVLHVVSALEKQEMARQVAENNLESVAELTAANVQSTLSGAGEALHGLARLPEIVSMSPQPAEQTLKRAGEVFSNFASIALLRLDGSVVASTADGGQANYADRPWVRRALTTNALAVGGYRIGRRSGEPGIAMAHPVLDAAGRIVGVCVLNLRLSSFTGIFAKSRLPEGSEACLFDDAGIVLASWPGPSPAVGHPLDGADALRARHDADPDTAWTAPGTDGSPFYYVTADVAADATTRFHILVGLPARAVLGPLEAVMGRDMVGLGLALALALVAAHLFAGSFLLGPIQRLVQMAAAMAGGDLARRSGLADGQGELAELGRALDAMADRLGERVRFTQDIIDAIPARIVFKGLDGRYLGCNRAYARDIHPQAEILGKTCRETESPAQAERIEISDAELLRNPEQTMEMEIESAFRDGSLHDMMVLKSVFKDASGRPAGIVNVALDITDRKRSEKALLASETKYRALLASIRDGFVVVDDNGRIMESNPAFREMVGYSRDELGRLTYKDLTPESWHETEETILRTAVDTCGFSDVFEKEYRRRDGSVVPVALRLHRYPSRAGENYRYFAIVRDITDVKAIEADLRQAKETAETANRAKSDFLAKMSHDIRTPLHAVIGMTELTLGTLLSAQQRDALETVRESAASLLALINDILDISRIEARKLDVAREDFDLRRTLAATVRAMRPQAAQKALFLGLAIAPAVPRFVTGDEVRVRQILTNLIGNALKFTDQGGVTVSVAPMAGPDAPGDPLFLEFTVADTGVGIPSDKLASIFEMFTQANASVGKHYGGTGLGLAICRELARLMGGGIRTESTPGRGSTFRVVLPLPQGQPLPPAEPVPQASPAGAAAPVGQAALRILLAEDNPVNIKVATSYLSRRGHGYTLAENGQVALARLAERPFDVVLMDLEMPELDGLETTRRLRAGLAGPANRDIPVIAMTAHALSGARERCLSAGMTDYLPKPLNFQLLDAMLQRIAAGLSPAAPQAAASAQPVLALDTERALLRLGGDAELLRELQSDFLRQYPRQLRLITLCSANENWDEAALAAHSLKNIAGAVGAESSRRLAGRLEAHLRQADADAAEEVLASLKDALLLAGETIRTRPAQRAAAPASGPDKTG
ncbi:multi-sensor hybrid histidine kinase [Solidesulfovibrio carbinoliphilus subsp. oakridgensis]|uniref:Sensory/regulatory protein RpfC n=1 Tax=Solidesulfovibrio carbinoliphilus subsp. oakridgensis TaxID=694327 RepID=G7Q7G2_9BACT|nr:PAS domain S-box protein [Solidesulfovibrio carbinoliphilus]EHJ47115.1 multi-sensor hybrid histidine kinase [Solidesulfovibrio carbinoliphilus subsp. oakridgensis]